MNKPRQLIYAALLIAVIALIALATNRAEADSPAERTFENLLASVGASDNYRFTAQMEQTLIPLATAENIGRSEERIDSMIIGQIAPDKNTLDLRFESSDIPNLLLEQENGNTYLIQNGERTLVDSPLAASAPDGSFAGYLHAATHIVERSDPNFPNYTIYQFELDGNAFGAYLAEQMRANLPANQQYRGVVPARTATLMNGVGEVWLDADGILRRQILDVTMPELNEQYGSQSHIVIDYQYGDETSAIRGLPDAVVPLVQAVVDCRSGDPCGMVETFTQTRLLTSQSTYQLLLVLITIGFVTLLLRRPRSLRVTLPIFLAFLMVVNPILPLVASAASEDMPQPQSLLDALNLNNTAVSDSSVRNTQHAIRNTMPALLNDDNSACGVSDDRDTDTDEDGLSDFVENCLGTSPYLTDTDGDQLGDMLEVTGFVFTDTQNIPTTYYSNPLEADSNFDGQSDLSEWARPYGTADKWDMDGDDKPNLWDTDDDGDGVSDSIDLDPAYTTDYLDLFRMTLYDNQEIEGYQIVEFQVQPEDHEHLRYTTHVLDWPYDAAGTIQDIDGSTDDLTLRPYLKVYTSDLPSEELMQMYGIQKFESTSEGFYYLYLPLSPIGDGGNIEAFSGTIVYDTQGLSGRTRWRESKLSWLAFFEQDDGSADLIAEYEEEAFRFSGLHVSRQADFDYAVLGTPNDPDDNLKLFQLMSALSASYLATLQVDLDSLERRFVTNPNPITTWGLMDDVTFERAETPPGFLAALPVELAKSYANFLTNNSYPQDELASLIVAMEGRTSLLTLGDSTTTDEIYLDQKTLKGKLNNAPMATVRSINMSFLSYANNAWGQASAETIADTMTTRYDVDAIAASLQDLYPGIDGADLIDTLALANYSLEDGMQTMIQYGDTTYVELVAYDEAVEDATAPAPQENIFSYLLRVGGLGVPGEGVTFDDYDSYLQYRYSITGQADWDAATMPLVMLGAKSAVFAGHILAMIMSDDTVTDIVTVDRSAQYKRVANEIERVADIESIPSVRPGPRNSVTYQVNKSDGLEDLFRAAELDPEVIGNETTIGGELADLADDEFVIGEYDMVEGGYDGDLDGNLNPDGEFEVIGDDFDDSGTPGLDADVCPTRRAANCGIDVSDLDNNIGNVDDIVVVKRAGAWAKIAPKLKKAMVVAGGVLEVAGLGLDLASIWTTYANFESIYQYERTQSLVFAVTMTVILVVVAVLSVFIAPLGFAFMFIDLVFLLADLIGLAHGQSVSTRDLFIAELIGTIWDVDSQTRVRDFEFGGLEMNAADPLLAGNRLKIEDQFTGVIQATYNTTIGELAHGSSHGYFRVTSDSDALSIAQNWDDPDCSDEPEWYYDSSARTYYPESQVCTNDLWVTVDFDAPAINAVVSLKHIAQFNTRYKECIFGDCTSYTDVATLPDELPDEQKWDYIDITLDILPATLTELWHWDALTALSTNDADADGLTYYYETELFDTDPNEWDSDRDELSDAFEAWSDLYANSADIDNDGLSDGLELRIGTGINDADSDDDGLFDGAEFSYYDDTGTWIPGGWSVDIDGGNFFVFASPFSADLDQDELNDRSETGQDIGTAASSPYAPNALVPAVSFTASPFQSASDGRYGVFVKQGDVVSATLTIDNFAAAAVDQVVKMCLPDAAWSNTSVVVSGLNPANLPTAVLNGDCYEWDFSAQPLYQFFDFEAVFTGQVGASGNITTPLTIEVPYTNSDGNRIIRDNVSFTVDNDAPSVLITEPLTNTRLAGDFFVVGGFASDDLTWVDHVEVTVPAGTFDAAGTTPWAYTWELPDGGSASVTAIAYDAAGNASAPFEVVVTVDSLAPVVTTNFADGATIAAGESYSDTIMLHGTVSDNYAGVVYVQMAYNNQPYRTIWSAETPQTSTAWSGEWELPFITESAQGEHTLRLRAADDYGNITVLEQSVFVDLLPPTNELTDRRFSADTIAHIPLNQPLTLQGVANDAGRNPTAAGPIALAGTLNVIDDATIWLQPDSFEVDDAGVTVAWIGDYNGDRLGDMAIGFPASSDGRGKVVVVTGRAGDWPNPNLGDMEQLFGKAPTFYGEIGAGLGATIAPAGDFDGDGFEDMLVGDLANNRVFLVYGNLGNQGSNLLLEGTNVGNWDTISAENETITQFASAGDVNNDGYSDILIATDSGVHLLVGGHPATTANVSDLSAATLAVGNASVTGVGDATGDLVADFAIAVPAGAGSGGTVHLFSGSSGWVAAGGSSLTTATAVTSFATSDAAPTLINAGDLNDDGFADFAFSSGDNPVVVYGGSYTTETIGGGFAATPNGFLAAAGDTNKDGKSDLLVGNADGDAYLLLGGDLNTIAATVEGVAGSASAPYTTGADLAGDGSADLLLVPSASAASNGGFGLLNTAKPAHISQDALPQRIYDFGLTIYDGESRQSSNVNRQSSIGDVTAGSADADYTSIQAAIDSGASRVLILPGVYYEAITLTSGVEVIGSGAGLTTLMLPAGESVIVSADGVTNAALLNLTLKSDGMGIGVAATNGAAVELERLLVEGMATAVTVDGATSDVNFKNISIIANVNGIAASNCADLDVRNTIFAYNTGTALAYEACASIQRHEFNLFYANGTDQTPNDPGSGEVFSNPRFQNYATGDYRVEDISPVINAGSPGDAVPPGAGDRIDIGHLEQTGGGYIASHDYCSTCENDGLIWGVNAFDTIQGAVDSAENDLLNLFGGDGSQFVVGVDSGTYTESITVSWNLQLLGSDPDNTTIQGVGGPAVTISATVGTKVGGFTLLGAGATPIGVYVTKGSSGVVIDRNLIKDNATGILFDKRSSGLVTFNTLVNNTTAIEATGKYNWADTNSNLLSGNSNGLVASNDGVVFSYRNLLNNTIDYTNVITGVDDILGVDPLLTGSYSYLTVGSPAVDAGDVREAVPSGGGLVADIGWHELRIAPISVLMGQADDSIATESYGVGSAEYAIVAVADPATPVTSTLPTTWTDATLDSPNEKLSYWDATFTPTTTGYYRIYSRATDGLGNSETNSDDWFDGAFYVDDTAPAVSISYARPSGVANTWLQLTGVVTDYIGTSFDIDQVYFTIDGERYEGRWSLDGWEADGVTGRTFHFIYENDTGSNDLLDLQAFAVDGAGQVGQSALLNDISVSHDNFTDYFDSTGPRIWHIEADDDYPSLIPPFQNNNIYSGTITFQGLAYDQRKHFGTDPQEGFSGIDGYQISFDGGLTWDTMERTIDFLNNLEGNGRILPYEWEIPADLDATTIPVKIRATDYDGNSQFAVFKVTVDTGAPRIVGTINLDAGPALGQHVDEITYLDFSWIEPTDGGGEVTMLGNFGQVEPTIMPTAVQPTNERIGARITEGGEWYALVGAEDEVGNEDWMWIGPWYAGQVRDPDAPNGLPWGGAIQSIEFTVDGVIDLTHGEYLTPTEWLDTDARSGSPQSLYNAWSAGQSFVGWSGADWETDGTLFVYYDLIDGGTTQPVSDTGSIVLPFSADFAVSYAGGGEWFAQQWQFDGNAWTTTGSPELVGIDQTMKGFEFKIDFELGNLESADNHRMMAYASDDSGEVWAAFPRNNSLNGTFAHYYDWNITVGGDLLELPTNAQLSDLDMAVSSDPSEATTLSHGETVTVVVTLANLVGGTTSGIQLQVTGSAGVNYQTVAGATCNDCAADDSWLLDVPALAVDATQIVTLTARLDADLTGLNAVTTTVELISASSDYSAETISHRLDLAAPSVTILRAPGNVISSAPLNIEGTADDGAGAGVALVEISHDQANWQSAVDTASWTALITPTTGHNSQLLVYARATDLHGQVSDVISATLVVDDVPPVITPTVPAIVGGASVVRLTGIASDPEPAYAEVAQVQIQIDGGNWETVNLAIADTNGDRDWLYSWQLPREDGGQHTIRYRAFDYAGNVVTSTAPLMTVVDTVAPVLNVDRYFSAIQVNDPTPVLSGTIADGHSSDSVRVVAQPTVGDSVELTATVESNGRAVGSSWRISADTLPVGSYTLIVLVTDEAGNETISDPYALEVTVGVPTSVDLQQLDTATGSQLLALWLLLFTFIGMVWVTHEQLRRYRYAKSVD